MSANKTVDIDEKVNLTSSSKTYRKQQSKVLRKRNSIQQYHNLWLKIIADVS